MRWIPWMLAVAVVGLAGPAAGYQPGCASCNGAGYRGLDAEPCASPCDYCLAPGCCEKYRHCCDNAWAGYCEHRAKVDAFWYRVGVPGNCGRGCPCRYTPVPYVPCDAPAPGPMQPTPAVAPGPIAPVPIPPVNPMPSGPVPKGP